MKYTFLDFLAEELLGLAVLPDGPGSHVEHLVTSAVDFVVEQADALVDVVGLELPHHVGPRYGAVDVRNHHLLLLVPEEDLELSLFEHPWGHLQYEFGLVFSGFQVHPLQQLGVWGFAVLDDLLLVRPRSGWDCRRLLLDIQFGNVVSSKYLEPALLVLGLYHLVDQPHWLLPEGELAGEHCCA